ncbi:PID-CTERM protein-sorting domain-containing protein [Rubrivirga marina]|uniref:VPDSG-CTERM protein sorting domain-containing protein n=1 Tax=Rubrivirga marina TaxID=1196024 RepID=A0A271IX94_9BACT|nr:hypothetical protein [Rubrivirga marina]PAP75856.1 hypothetical protein BSZ37_05070 [Rubrivirga marina]
MRLITIALALAFAVDFASAQSVPDWAAPIPPDERTTDPGGSSSAGTPPANPFTPAPVPLDGGLALLALAGAGLAARMLHQRHED